jgi:16S rRNA U516 pseudouridylate synthase RsuA-like enzyme
MKNFDVFSIFIDLLERADMLYRSAQMKELMIARLKVVCSLIQKRSISSQSICRNQISSVLYGTNIQSYRNFARLAIEKEDRARHSDDEQEGISIFEDDSGSATNSKDSALKRRLSKLISGTGYVSRHKAEELIKEGRVSIKGRKIRSPSLLVDVNDLSFIEIDNVLLKRQYKKGKKPATPSAVSSSSSSSKPSESSKTATSSSATLQQQYLFPRLWAMMKVKQESMNSKDNLDGRKRPLLINRLKVLIPKVLEEYGEENFRPIYRLNYTTEGLVLYTNNGELAKLFHSSALNYSMKYRFKIHGKLTPEKISALQSGKIHNPTTGKRLTSFPTLTIDKRSNTTTWLTITTTEKELNKIISTFKMIYLTVTRVICLGIGPYEVEKIFPIAYKNNRKKKFADLRLQEQLEKDNTLKEISLNSEIHSLFLKLQNNKLSYKMTSKPTSSSSSSSSTATN